MNPQLTKDLEKLVAPPSPAPQARDAAAAPPKRSILPRLFLFALLAAAAYFGWTYRAQIQSYFTPAQPAASGRRGGGIASVVAAPAKTGDVHVYLEGLGLVTPFATEIVRTRVDGQIMKIEFTEGQFVHANDSLLEIDPRPYQAQLDQAQGQLTKDQAVLDNAKIDLDRYEESFKNGSISDQTLATQRATVKQDEGVVTSDQSQVDNARLNLVYCHVLAGIDGRIGLQQVNVGNIVHAADTTGLATIAQLQPIAVIFTLSEDDLPQVISQPNFGVGLEVDAFDRSDQTRLAIGKVEAVDNAVDVASGTFKVKAEFANKDNALFPNQFVNAHLLAETKKNVVLVPTAAVQHGPDGSAFVYVIKTDQTAEIRPVTTGDSEGDSTSVTGVQPAELVVTDGTDRLISGSKVTVTLASESGAPTTAPSTRPGARGRGRRGGGPTTTPVTQ